MTAVTDEHEYKLCGLVGCSFIMAHSHGADDGFRLGVDEAQFNHRVFKGRETAGALTWHDFIIDGHFQVCVHPDVRSREECQVGRDKEPTKQRKGDQALPKQGRECVQDLVITKMEESKRVGMERYGSTLQTFNGRRSIQDCAEEARDLMVYLTQVEREAEADRETLIKVVAKALHPEPDGEDEATAMIAVDAIMGWVIGQKST